MHWSAHCNTLDAFDFHPLSHTVLMVAIFGGDATILRILYIDGSVIFIVQ